MKKETINVFYKNIKDPQRQYPVNPIRVTKARKKMTDKITTWEYTKEESRD